MYLIKFVPTHTGYMQQCAALCGYPCVSFDMSYIQTSFGVRIHCCVSDLWSASYMHTCVMASGYLVHLQ